MALAAPPAARPPSAPPKRSASFWERTKQSTVGVWGLGTSPSSSLPSPTSPSSSSSSLHPTSLDVEAVRCARTLRTLTFDAVDLPAESLADRRKSQIALRKIPPEAVQSAHGLAILTVFRSTGTSLFGGGGAVKGSGVVVSRLPDGAWSSPSGLLLETGGFAFSAGVDVYDIVLLLRNERAVESFFEPQTTLGRSRTSVAPGPVGSAMLLDDAAEVAAIWSYAKSNDLYEAVKLDGTVLVERRDENARTYERAISSEEILNGAAPRSDRWCQSLHEVIRAAQGSDFRPEYIPQGPSPSESFAARPPLESPLAMSTSSSSSSSSSSDLHRPSQSNSTSRRLPKEELSEEDLAAKRELEEAMKSFGIEDPTGYERSRSQDPLLVVATASCDREGSDRGATTLSHALRESVDVDERLDSQRARDDDTTPASSSSSKPPVPPRRTPRTPIIAAASPEVRGTDEDSVRDDADEKDPATNGPVRRGGEESEQGGVVVPNAVVEAEANQDDNQDEEAREVAREGAGGQSEAEQADGTEVSGEAAHR